MELCWWVAITWCGRLFNLSRQNKSIKIKIYEGKNFKIIEKNGKLKIMKNKRGHR